MVWSSLSVVGRSRAEEGCGQEKSILCACGGRNETVPRSAGSDQNKKESQRERGKKYSLRSCPLNQQSQLGRKGLLCFSFPTSAAKNARAYSEPTPAAGMMGGSKRHRQPFPLPGPGLVFCDLSDQHV